jgi:AraC-like DNA-binding protein
MQRRATATPQRRPTRTAGKPGFLSTQVTEAHRYHLNLTPASDARFEVICGGVERCRQDYVVARNSFPYLAVEFVAEGLGSIRLAGRDHVLRPGVAFAYAPGVRHTIRSNPRRPMLKYYVDFVGAEAERLLAESPLGRWDPVQVSSPNEIIEILEALQRNGTAQSPFAAKICTHLVSLLILKISEKSIPHGPKATRAFPAYERVRQYLQKHFLELKTIEAAAAACHVNVSYLCRLFQRFSHQTPYRLLMRLKMNRAAELLLDGGLRVKEVAGELRFSDPYNFSRAFKQVYGLAPDQFVRHGRRRGLESGPIRSPDRRVGQADRPAWPEHLP